jgi:AcrR family transcriptional regulator
VAYRTTPKMMERKEARRAKLLRTAVVLFGKRGYHATTVPMIVKASGSSTGSFYFYFRNKEDVFAAALAAFGERISQTINSAIAEVRDDPRGQMRAAIESFVLLLADNPSKARISIVESSGLGVN